MDESCALPLSSQYKRVAQNENFYPRGASDARVLAIIVCLSVCVSVCHTPVFIKAAKRRITQTTPRDSPGTLVF